MTYLNKMKLHMRECIINKSIGVNWKIRVKG